MTPHSTPDAETAPLSFIQAAQPLIRTCQRAKSTFQPGYCQRDCKHSVPHPGCGSHRVKPLHTHRGDSGFSIPRKSFHRGFLWVKFTPLSTRTLLSTSQCHTDLAFPFPGPFPGLQTQFPSLPLPMVLRAHWPKQGLADGSREGRRGATVYLLLG